MLQYSLAFFAALLTALASENPVFARALGLDKSIMLAKSSRYLLLSGLLLTVLTALSSIPVWGANQLLINLDNFDMTYLQFARPPIYFICVTLIYFFMQFSAKHLLPDFFVRIREALPGAAFNSALFGALYVTATQNFDFFRTIGYSIGMGLGYTAALLIIHNARDHLSMSDVPRSFRGIPILLVYIGLISLAIFGLVGHKLLS